MATPEDPGSDSERGEAAARQAPKPRWFTPLRLLIIFCVANIMVYLDRGVIASNGVNGSPRTPENPQGSGIQGDFNLSNTQDGLLATAFLVGLLVASPLFSEACKHVSAFRLLAAGMGIWALAVLGCGLSFNFESIFVCRMLVGVGEASFIALAVPFIDDYAPPASKGKWFAYFYLCIPSGFAAGYMFGGAVAAAFGWRAAFYIIAASMVPFVALMLLSAPLHLHGMHDVGPDPARPRGVKQAAREAARDAATVMRHPVWALMVAAYVMHTAVMGVYAFWGPKAGKEIYGLAGTTADLVFGGVTVVTGVLGGLHGGALTDYLGATLRNACLVCAGACLCGAGLLLGAFLGATGFWTFIALFGAGEFAIFTIQAPIGAIGMWSVPASVRPLAISLCTIFIHLLGDVPSPPLLGYLKTRLSAGLPPGEAAQQWRVALSVFTLLLVPSGALFLWNAKVSGGAPDYRTGAEKAAAAAKAKARLSRSGGGARRSSTGGGGGSGGGGGGGLRLQIGSGGGGGAAAGTGAALGAPESFSTRPLLGADAAADAASVGQLSGASDDAAGEAAAAGESSGNGDGGAATGAPAGRVPASAGAARAL